MCNFPTIHGFVEGSAVGGEGGLHGGASAFGGRGVCLWSEWGLHLPYGKPAVGTHPTGMHSCFIYPASSRNVTIGIYEVSLVTILLFNLVMIYSIQWIQGKYLGNSQFCQFYKCIITRQISHVDLLCPTFCSISLSCPEFCRPKEEWAKRRGSPTYQFGYFFLTIWTER